VEYSLAIPGHGQVGFDISVPLRTQLGLRMRRHDDREAEFEAFFVAQFERVCRSVGVVCGDQERANDATQEAFIRAYAHWGRIRNYDDVAAWVRRIAIHASYDAGRAELRRRRREDRVNHRADRDVERTTDAEQAEHDSALELLSALPDRQRAIAALFYLDDLSVAEIAVALGIAEGTVRFHLTAARQRLRSELPAGEHVIR
jgi:RNA polymerase sigma factor (sigma-70 family)